MCFFLWFYGEPGIEPATPGLQGIALIHYTTGASLYRTMKKFLALSFSDVVLIMLINVKMPTIVGILTIMSRINSVLS